MANPDANSYTDVRSECDAVIKPRGHVLALIAVGGVAAACVPRPSLPAETAPAAAVLATTASSSASAEEPPSAGQPGAVEPTPIQFAFPTPGPDPVSAWRPPPYAVPLAIRPEDHFYFLRPIPSGNVNWPHPLYRYGNTFFGEESIHTGVDLDAPRGTPVLAAAAGQVMTVGFGLYSGLQNPNDPYGLAVSIRHDFGYHGKVLYTVYAHLQETRVWVGQRVDAGEQIGSVGDTGNADGAHLHFEVRLGQDGYFTTRNPELWMVPPEGWGVLAGLVMDSYGRPLAEQLVQIRSLETDKRWEVWAYALDTVHPDESYGENFVISDLPAGPYEVRIDYAGHPYTAQLLLIPGRTNFLTFRGRSGFQLEATAEPARAARPPYP